MLEGKCELKKRWVVTGDCRRSEDNSSLMVRLMPRCCWSVGEKTSWHTAGRVSCSSFPLMFLRPSPTKHPKTLSLFYLCIFSFLTTLACLIYSNFQNDALSSSDACPWHILGCQISSSKACHIFLQRKKYATNSRGEKRSLKNVELQL